MNSLILAQLEFATMIRGATVAFSLVATILTALSLLYAKKVQRLRGMAPLDKKRAALSLYSVAIIKALKKLTALNLIALIYVSFALLTTMLYAEPRPPLQPTWVYYVNLGAFFIFLFHVALPSLLMVVLIREARKLSGNRDSKIIEALDPNGYAPNEDNQLERRR